MWNIFLGNFEHLGQECRPAWPTQGQQTDALPVTKPKHRNSKRLTNLLSSLLIQLTVQPVLFHLFLSLQRLATQPLLQTSRFVTIMLSFVYRHRLGLPSKVKVKVKVLAIALLTWVKSRVQKRFYNLGSGSWLAKANDTAVHYAAIHCPR